MDHNIETPPPTELHLSRMRPRMGNVGLKLAVLFPFQLHVVLSSSHDISTNSSQLPPLPSPNPQSFGSSSSPRLTLTLRRRSQTHGASLFHENAKSHTRTVPPVSGRLICAKRAKYCGRQTGSGSEVLVLLSHWNTPLLRKVCIPHVSGGDHYTC